jgi:hypothetical protein
MPAVAVAPKPLKKAVVHAELATRPLGVDVIPYTFLFEGQSMAEGRPCANTRILIRLQEGNRIRVARGMTDQAGSYSIHLTFEMTPKTSVEWTLEAVRKEYASLEMSGRHIAITGDTSVTVERSFDLALR